MAPKQEGDQFCDTTLSQFPLWFLFLLLWDSSWFFRFLSWAHFFLFSHALCHSFCFWLSSSPQSTLQISLKVQTHASICLLISYKQGKPYKTTSKLICFLSRLSLPVSPSQCAQHKLQHHLWLLIAKPCWFYFRIFLGFHSAATVLT